MIIIKLCVIAVAGVLTLGVIKTNNSSHRVIIELSVVAIIIFFSLPHIRELLEATQGFVSTGEFTSGALKLMLKAFVILTVGSFCGDICRDNGESAVANAVEVGSRFVAVACALPVFSAVISIAESFMQG